MSRITFSKVSPYVVAVLVAVCCISCLTVVPETKVKLTDAEQRPVPEEDVWLGMTCRDLWGFDGRKSKMKWLDHRKTDAEGLVTFPSMIVDSACGSKYVFVGISRSEAKQARRADRAMEVSYPSGWPNCQTDRYLCSKTPETLQATQAKNSSLCQRLDAVCHAEVALVTDDIAVCNNHHCAAYFAFARKEPRLCATYKAGPVAAMPEHDLRALPGGWEHECYMKYGKLAHDPDVCDMVRDSIFRDVCFDAVEGYVGTWN